MLTVGPFAIETYEPRQVRNEAAVSKTFYVPEDTLARANCQSNAWKLIVEVGCTTKKVSASRFLCQTLFGVFFYEKMRIINGHHGIKIRDQL